MGQMILSGGDTEKDLPFKKSEVTHLRLLLAWMRCQYMLDEDMQAGYADGLRKCLEADIASEERLRQLAIERAEKIEQAPKYVRHGIKMLTKMLREHDKLGDVVDGEVAGNRIGCEPLALPSNVELTGATPAGGASALTQMLGME